MLTGCEGIILAMTLVRLPLSLVFFSTPATSTTPLSTFNFGLSYGHIHLIDLHSPPMQ